MKSLPFQYIFFLVILISVLISCNNNEVKNSYYSNIIKTEKGLIRGINLNDSKKEIKKHEKKKAITLETDIIIEYEYSLKKDGNYVITYQFDQRGCYEIDIDIYPKNTSILAEIQTLLTGYFNKKFGNPIEEESLLIWKDKNKTLTIELDLFNLKNKEIILTIFANE